MRALVFVLLFPLLCSPAVWPQESPENQPGKPSPPAKTAVQIKGTLGYANFLDEDPLRHFVAGGSARIRIVDRLGFEPELTFLYRSIHDRDLLLIPNITWDFRSTGRVIPYVIGGIGILYHWEKWDHFAWMSAGRTFGGGVGAKIFLSPSVFVAPEVRLGWEPIFRITGSIGYALK